MFAMCRDVHPATGIEHALSCYFFSASAPEKNLVVGGVNYVRVYRLVAVGNPHEGYSDDAEVEALYSLPKAKLECAAAFSVHGTIADMKAVRLAGSIRDALVLCFRDAKVSVVEYDPYSHSLKTISLHYFEEEAAAGGWTDNYFVPTVSIDPEGRAAAISFFGSKIAIIPFRREAVGGGGTGTSGPEGDGQANEEIPSPVMTSYVIDLKSIDPKIDAVIDAKFLHGYYEPTLLVLFEPLRTFSGRVMLRPDTCSMIAMSLNTADGSHPVIWSVAGLPFDCSQAVPIARPIGGCLVIAVNCLIYLNQSMPPYGVAVNCIPATTTSFPLKPLSQEGVSLTFDCARVAVVKEPDVMVVSVASGDIWVLTLVSDGMLSVRGFHLDKAATAVMATCVSPVEDGYLFLGSRLGNSQLLRYMPRDQVRLDIVKKEEDKKNKGSKEDEEVVPSKKKRKKEKEKSDALADWLATGVEELDNEIEIYGTTEDVETVVENGETDGKKLSVSKKTITEQISNIATFAAPAAASKIVHYIFESCDSLLNIGPCGKMSLGQPAFLPQEFWSNERIDLDLLLTSGFGKGGSLSIVHRSIRPQLITTFPLPGCVDMWTVVGEKGSGVHDFLILSCTNTTMVLETGEELNEVESGGFILDKPTVYACNLGNNRFIVQVTAFSMVLLKGKELVHLAPVDVKNPVILARVADPYVVLLGAGGEVKLAKLVEPKGKAYMDIVSALPIQQSRAVAMSTYTDYSGMFAAAGPHGVPGVTANLVDDLVSDGTVADATDAGAGAGTGLGLDKDAIDEDELLYGESDASLLSAFSNRDSDQLPGMEKFKDARKPGSTLRPTGNAPLVTQWVFLARQNGNLEIYSLPDFSMKFLARGFSLGPYVLTNSMTDTWVESRVHDVPITKEILVVGLGSTKTCRGNASLKPMLFAFVGEDLLIFEAFPFFEGKSLDDPYIKVRFRKIEHDYIVRANLAMRPVVKQEKGTYSSSKLVHFSEIGSPASFSGVFVAGSYPHWAMMGQRGDLKVHPMNIDGPVTCFAPFDNINCPKGFLYFNGNQEMRICLLPSQFNYDTVWPTRKVPLKCTPRFLAYHVETKTYAVATSTETESNQMYRFNGEDKESVIESRPENFPLPYVTSFAIQLFSPVSWDVVPDTKVDMDEYEHVTDMKNVALIYEGAASGLKGYIAIATNYIYGEDITCKGRILIMDVLEVVPEPGRPLTKNKMKQLYGKEQKGPVTAIAAVQGLLVSAIGQKIYLWQLKDADLVGIAFIDTQIYTHQLLCLKNFILVGDMFKSITLLQYQESHRTICVIGRDMTPLEVFGAEFAVCDKALGFVVTDRNRNLSIYGYHPEARETSGVPRLVRRADFHLGSNVNHMLRIKAKVMDPSGCLRPPKFGDRRQVTWYCTLDGSIGWVLPLHEVQYRVLMSIQNVLHTFMPHMAGLNPKSHRIHRLAGRRGPAGIVNPAKNIVDGNVVFKYLHLPLTEKLEVTKRTGLTIDEITDVLLECSRVTDLF